MQARLRIALILTVALALPALLAAAPAPAPPAPAGAAAAACAPAPSAAGGLFAPPAATASPIQTPWGGTIPAATCDCSGYDCGAGCYPYQCVVLFGGRCGAICKCSP